MQLGKISLLIKTVHERGLFKTSLNKSSEAGALYWFLLLG